MANLPPKAPTIAVQDNSLPNPPGAAEPNNPSWADDFVGYSASKRRAHRRSISDVSMALVEEPTFVGGCAEFEMRFDDEAQLIMSMFNNQLKHAVNASPTSDKRRCHGDYKPGEHDEVESSKCNNDNQGNVVSPPSPVHGNGAVFDPKRVKRILANRQSAQRSRVRKLQYVSELERSMTRLQTEVSMLTPRVAYLDHHRMMLNVDNTTLKSQIAALSHDKLFKDAHQEALKREIERLKQVYHQQSSITSTPTPDPSPPSGAPVAHPQ